MTPLPSRLRSNARYRKWAAAYGLVRVVVRGGVEPPTFRFSGGRSYQLSYLTKPEPVPGKDAGNGSSGPDGI
jgi:hypothetical protein